MSLLLLNCSPFRASFAFGKREKFGKAKSIYKQETDSHSMCSVAQTLNKSSFSANLFPKLAWPLPYQLQDVQ
jgi:hypothetical protein